MTDHTLTEGQGQQEQPAPGEHLHLGWALVIICVAQLMVVLDGTITNIAIPYIGRDLGIPESGLSWLVTGYALAFGGLLLLGGRLGDLYGRRRIFVTGLLIFSTASFLGGIAPNEPLLLAGRALQGLGAALAAPAALALIQTTFPAGPSRNRAFAVYSAMSGAGAAVGLILGGALTGADSILGAEGWRWTFLINVPIGVVAALAALRILRESGTHRGELDVPGAVTATLGLLGLVYGLTRASDTEHGWGDTWTIASLAAGAALLALFALVESRVEHPLLPVRVFRNRTRATSYVVMMLVPAAMFAMFFFLSLFIQNVMGYSPLRTGFAFLPFTLGIVSGAAISSNLVSRVDPRWIAGTGTLFASAALFGFSRLETSSDPGAVASAVLSGDALGADVTYWTQILPFVLMMSFGMGLTFVPVTLTAVHHLRAEESGIGSGVLNTMQQVGGALGLAALSTVFSSAVSDRAGEIGPGLTAALVSGGVPADDPRLAQIVGLASFTDGATDAFLVGSAMVLLGSLIALFLLDVEHEELATDGPSEGAVHV